MPIIQDEEFGKITIRRSSKATQVRLRIAPDGTLRASMPIFAPIFLVKRLLKNSRKEIQKMISQTKPVYAYENGMQIGKSHTLIIQKTDNKSISVINHGQQILVKLPNDMEISNATVSRKIRDAIINALRLEAKNYLTKRLSYIAKMYSYSYLRVRFSHASGRWGSCSSNGTISLNIALMKLPYEQIDYVIIHELSHTIQMNHSKDFWKLVEKADPYYREHRRQLKLQTPTI